MRNFLAILERELKSYFFSPVAYVVLGFFVLATGVAFYTIVSWFNNYSMQAMMMAQQYRQMPPALNVNQMVVRPLFGNIAIIALLVVPGLTMRLLAEEKRQGTMELLATSPITNWQITLGKFTAAWLYYATMLLATGFFVALLFLYGNPEFLPILSGYLGLLLLGGCFIALGLLFSAFTENQIVALASAFFVNLIFVFLGWLGNFAGATTSKVLAALSPLDHLEDFSKGVIDSTHTIFYLSFIFGGLFLTFVAVESSRWRGAR